MQDNNNGVQLIIRTSKNECACCRNARLACKATPRGCCPTRRRADITGPTTHPPCWAPCSARAGPFRTAAEAACRRRTSSPPTGAAAQRRAVWPGHPLPAQSGGGQGAGVRGAEPAVHAEGAAMRVVVSIKAGSFLQAVPGAESPERHPAHRPVPHAPPPPPLLGRPQWTAPARAAQQPTCHMKQYRVMCTAVRQPASSPVLR
jgi:hypothetical protein